LYDNQQISSFPEKSVLTHHHQYCDFLTYISPISKNIVSLSNSDREFSLATKPHVVIDFAVESQLYLSFLHPVTSASLPNPNKLEENHSMEKENEKRMINKNIEGFSTYLVSTTHSSLPNPYPCMTVGIPACPPTNFGLWLQKRNLKPDGTEDQNLTKTQISCSHKKRRRKKKREQDSTQNALTIHDLDKLSSSSLRDRKSVV
jgi:hypothetical protein